MTAFRLIVLAAAATLLAGCSSYSAPELSIEKAELRERTPSGMVLEFTINAENRNSEPLPLREVRYRLLLDGNEVFSGTRSAEATLRRYGGQRFTLPAVITPGGEGVPTSGVVPFRISGSLKYITPGELAAVLFDAEVRQPEVSFDLEGRIDLTAK